MSKFIRTLPILKEKSLKELSPFCNDLLSTYTLNPLVGEHQPYQVALQTGRLRDRTKLYRSSTLYYYYYALNPQPQDCNSEHFPLCHGFLSIWEYFFKDGSRSSTDPIICSKSRSDFIGTKIRFILFQVGYTFTTLTGFGN